MSDLIGLAYQTRRRSRGGRPKHLQTARGDLKISVAIWFFAPRGGPFHIPHAGGTVRRFGA